MDFDYAGLNDIGWVRRVTLNGRDITSSVLDDLELLRRIYTANLFDADALATYRSYLNTRNASYMKLEAEATSTLNTDGAQGNDHQTDPFQSATGYHRIALDVMCALLSDEPRKIVLNIQNGNSIPDLLPNDIAEVACEVDRGGARPTRVGSLPESVRGLVLSVKAYERTLIQASLEKSCRLAQLALLEYPVLGDWEIGVQLLDQLREHDSEFLGYLR